MAGSYEFWDGSGEIFDYRGQRVQYVNWPGQGAKVVSVQDIDTGDIFNAELAQILALDQEGADSDLLWDA